MKKQFDAGLFKEYGLEKQKIEPTPQVVFRTKGAMKIPEFRQAMKELVEDYKVSPNFEIDQLFLAKAIVFGR
jgi:hypothetical protein